MEKIYHGYTGIVTKIVEVRDDVFLIIEDYHKDNWRAVVENEDLPYEEAVCFKSLKTVSEFVAKEGYSGSYYYCFKCKNGYFVDKALHNHK